MNPQVAVVKAHELGLRCWLPQRFIEGTRCSRVLVCTYPEKKACKAVDAEIAYYQKRIQETTRELYGKIESLIAERAKGKESL